MGAPAASPGPPRSGRSRPPRGRPPRCPGRPGSSCRSRTGPPGRASRRPWLAACPGSSRASGRRRGRPGPGRPARRRTLPATRRGWSEVVDEGRGVDRGAAPRRRAPSPRPARGRRDAARMRSTRSGSSVPWSGTPTQTSRIGSWRRVSGDHTTGIGMGRAWQSDVEDARVRVARLDGAMPRARDLGIVIGSLPTGPTNSVLDVPGVGLGHATVLRDEPPPPEGRGLARTGVTCLVLAEDAFTRLSRPAGRSSTAPASARGSSPPPSGARRRPRST